MAAQALLGLNRADGYMLRVNSTFGTFFGIIETYACFACHVIEVSIQSFVV
jgi:hypothetical protein